MKNPLAWARVCARGLAVALTITAPMTVAIAQKAPASYNSTFSIAEQSLNTQGRTVVVMQGTGDLPGVLTLVLSLSADGTISSGEWALNVSSTAAAGEHLIQRGVLSGTIGGGSTTSSQGLVSAINSLQLVVARGTLQFAAVTRGSGSVVGTHIDNRASSNAYTSLTF